jgi:hypothetical protein
MFKTSGLLGKIITILIFFIPAVSFAEDNAEVNIEVGRAGVLMEKASDGLSKLLSSGKADISAKWADELQDKAAVFCEFIQKKLKDNHLDDKDIPICSVE